MTNTIETKTRSGSKSVLWRLFGIFILAAVTYVYTRKWITTGLITSIHHSVFLVVYYFHERLWLKVRRVRSLTYRSLLKMFTYETLCGNAILGIITYLVTGSWKQMTVITLTYIGIKHICYIFNEFVWDKIKIGKYIVVLFLLLLDHSESSFADYWVENAIKTGNFRIDTEIRMNSDVYYRHIQFGGQYRLNNFFMLSASIREIYNSRKFEHNPILDINYTHGMFKNRFRTQLRMTDNGNIWRFRNKTTITKAYYFLAFETFFEEGKLFRNRYYTGINANENFSFFLMHQDTNNEKIWVLGTNFTTEILK